jgi:hypothetical protein
MELLPLDQGKYLVGCRDDGLLEFFEIAECALARRRWRSASEFEHDERMAQHLVHRNERLKHRIAAAEMGKPDRGIRKDDAHRGSTSAGRRRGMSFILGAFPPKAASRLPACTTHVVFEPLDFLARLAALVPRLRVNLTRYHGVFAPNSAQRAWVTKAGQGRGTRDQAAARPEDTTPAERRASMSWAQRLKRVFSVDIQTCAARGGAVRIIACIEDPASMTCW